MAADPDHDQAWYLLGRICQRQGDKAQAERALAAVKEIKERRLRAAPEHMARRGVRARRPPLGLVGRSGTGSRSRPWSRRARSRRILPERNLLKVRITATHVANAVLYFATRQKPTTDATIPVDGGLPEATPR